MMEYKKALGAAIRKLRRERKLSISSLHYETRIGRQALAEIERGEVYARLETLLKVCQALEVKPSILFEMAGL